MKALEVFMKHQTNLKNISTICCVIKSRFIILYISLRLLNTIKYQCVIMSLMQCLKPQIKIHSWQNPSSFNQWPVRCRLVLRTKKSVSNMSSVSDTIFTLYHYFRSSCCYHILYEISYGNACLFLAGHGFKWKYKLEKRKYFENL